MNPLTSFFSWLRRRSAESVLEGIADAATALETGAPPAPLALPEAIRERLSLAGPGNGRKATKP